MAEVTATTRDTLHGGRLVLHQPARKTGYRVNVDALLLADFAREARGHRVRRAIDLGSGVGAVGLSLLLAEAVEHVTFVEVDEMLASLCQENIEENGWVHRAEVARGDASEFRGTGDLVVCNPPYVAPGRGRAPAAPLARARSGSLGLFLDAARRIAGRRARVCLVYPAIETTTLLAELRSRGLEPKRLRFVYGRSREPARVVLVDCAAGRPGGLVVDPPLVEQS